MNILRRVSVVGAAMATFVVLAGSAAAAGWSNPGLLEPGCKPDPLQCTVEPAPRAAVNSHGQAAVAWATTRVVSKTRSDYLIRVATSSKAGAFGKGVTLGKGLRPATAITPDGVVTVVWSDSGTLRYSRGRIGHSFSKPAVLTPKGSKNGDDSPKLATEPGGSTVVLYENAYRTSAGKYVTRLRSVVLPQSGPVAAPMELGNGFLDHDSFRASANGQVAVCCLRATISGGVVVGPTPPPPPATPVLTYSRGDGWGQVVPPAVANRDVETVATGGGDVLLGTVDAVNHGDAGSFGTPGVLRADSTGTLGVPMLAPIKVARYAFGPIVAIDGSGRSVLVYQEKDKSAAFSRTAPVYAVTAEKNGTFGARQRLDSSRANQPEVRPYGTGSVAAWQTGSGTWGVAIERDGSFTKALAPKGGPSGIGADFNYNHDMTTAGRYIVLAWTAKDGSVRASRGVL